MLNCQSGRLSLHITPPQVELNTIASSFGCLSSLMTRLHTFLAGRVPGLVSGWRGQGTQDLGWWVGARAGGRMAGQSGPGLLGEHQGGTITEGGPSDEPPPLNAASTIPPPSPVIQDIARIPANPAIEGIPDAIAAAARAHGAEGGVVIMVVQPGERNAYDQQV